MKRTLFSLTIAVLEFSLLPVLPVRAQIETPPVGPIGEIRGSVMNTNSGSMVNESMDVMLHILDENYADVNMLHGQSGPDGTFVFADVPFASELRFAVMATFDGVTYASNPVPADMESLSVSIDVPVYDTTNNLENVHVDQMHVLFELSPDGLETREFYIISNTGERTVKDVFDLGEDKFATLEFPLPADADYIFFKPDDAARFLKQQGSFADTYAMLPGGQPSQIVVSYLVPFSGERIFSYTAPLDITQINLIVPDQSGLSVSGTGLTGPESMTLRDGLSYLAYSYSDLKARQMLNITLVGTSAASESSGQKSNDLLAVGSAFFGFAVIGVGVWRWRKSNQVVEEDETPASDEPIFDDLITEIALLDETYERKGLSEGDYQQQRRELLRTAKRLSQ